MPRAASPRRGVTLAEKASCALSEGILLPSSLIPAHAPDPCPPSVSGFPRRVVFAGCYQPPLRKGPSRRYLCESFPACLDPYPGGSCGASARFFPQDDGFPGMRTRSAPDDAHTATSVWNVISGLQSFAYVQAHQFARHPDCSYRSAFAPGSRGFYIRAYHGSLPPRAADMLTVRFGQLTVRGFSPLKIRSLVGCSSHATLAQTGFDPLLAHLNSSGLSCRRVESFDDLLRASAPSPLDGAISIDAELVVCRRCGKSSTIEHHGGRWCTNCGSFATPPDPALLPSSQPGYSEPRYRDAPTSPLRNHSPTANMVCGWCNQPSDMAGGIYDDGEWMCGDCIARYAHS